MKKVSIIALLIIFVSSGILAEEQTIGADEFIATVKERAPEFQISSLDTQIAKEKIHSADSVDEITVDASVKYYYSENYQPAGTNLTEETSGLKSSVGAKKKISAAGTELSATFDHNAYTEHGIEQKDYYNPAVTLGIAQPLLYNFFGAVDRFAKDDVLIAFEISKLEQRLADQEAVNYYQTLYSDWAGYRQVTALSARHVVNAETLYNQVLRKKAAGLVENDDVQEAYSSLLNHRQLRENYRLSLKKIEAEVVQAIGAGFIPDDEYLAARVRTIRQKEYSAKDFSETLQASVMNSSLEQMKKSEKVQQNKLLPQLDLIAAYTTKNLSENAGDIVNPFAKNEFSVGFQMSYTFGNSAADASYQTAVLNLKSLSESARKSMLSYMTRRDSVIAAIESGKKNLQLTEQNIAALRSQLATQSKKYDQSRITLSTLLATRNQIANAEINLVSAQLSLIALDNDYETLTQ